ncbi:DUF5946 family protein [Modestobacter italicus]|uniref:DUF5946 family protein n=1 Tax=Modestobacter italicus (strain DSM 44449 / CECT 9708 / BC 501) TaxID=2732864 RepID=UPI001C93AB2B|nr:DUF5946 family protein [Modestobacter italicus]
MSPADVPDPADGLATTAPETSSCPGCGAVLVVVPGLEADHPGASASCAGLFRVTVRGLREEAPQDHRSAALLQLATDAYDAQHLPAGAPAGPAVRLCLDLDQASGPRRASAPGARVDDPPSPAPPAHWTTTVADLAADLDVVDLPALLRAWAEAVWQDWSHAHRELRAAADGALTS